MKLVLASESPRRREILASLGIPFAIHAAKVKEVAQLPTPEEVPCFNARLKAEAVAELHPDAMVLGADTVILFEGKIIGKPRDLRDAENTLMNLAGKTHQVITGMALVCRNEHFSRCWSESTSVTFKLFPRSQAQEYISLVHVLDKAGSYAIQEHPELIIESIDGSLENVIGLPTSLLLSFLSEKKVTKEKLRT